MSQDEDETPVDPITGLRFGTEGGYSEDARQIANSKRERRPRPYELLSVEDAMRRIGYDEVPPDLITYSSTVKREEAMRRASMWRMIGIFFAAGLILLAVALW